MDNNINTPQTGSTLEYPNEIYEPVLATSIELDEFMRKAFTISYFDLDGDHEVHACYGDIPELHYNNSGMSQFYFRFIRYSDMAGKRECPWKKLSFPVLEFYIELGLNIAFYRKRGA